MYRSRNTFRIVETKSSRLAGKIARRREKNRLTYVWKPRAEYLFRKSKKAVHDRIILRRTPLRSWRKDRLED